MPNQADYTWGAKKNLDTIACLPEDVKQFKDLLYAMHGFTATEEEPTSEVQPGAILKGTVVDISKDFVVVDVGLKSEGVIPMSEFIDSSEGLTVGPESGSSKTIILGSNANICQSSFFFFSPPENPSFTFRSEKK